jgi:hypothetical protein
MRSLTFILGAAAAIGMVAAVSAKPAPDRIQLAQAQESQSGASQRSSTGNREGGAATTRSSQSSGAAAGGGGRATMRSEGKGTSRTSVRTRSEGARVSVRGSRTRVGVRTAVRDEGVIVHRKKARRYVYSEPARATVIKKKKRYVSYREPSSVVVKKRRAGVAVSEGVSTRTSVRSRTVGGTSVRGSSTTRTSGGTGANVRSSGQGGGGKGGATEGRTGQSRGTNQSKPSGGEAPATR